jgi:fluoride ion exporter CrcB/FEX
MECNKSFFLQWDLSWGNAIGSYNGARFFEWLTCMWMGVALPISALHLGYFCAKHLFHGPSALSRTIFIASENASSPSTVVPTESDKSVNSDLHAAVMSGGLVFLFFITLLLTIILPVVVYPEWIHFTYTAGPLFTPPSAPCLTTSHSLTRSPSASLSRSPSASLSLSRSAVLGIAGAYLRYSLSFLNQRWPNFPIGTFAANIAGTWIVAATTTVSKFGVGYYNVDVQAVLYGITYGFCGCLTTVSTLVKELDTLRDVDSLVYGVTSHAVAQVGIILLYNIYAYQTVPQRAVMPPPVDLCKGTLTLCQNFLDKVGCSPDLQVNVACDDMGDYATFQGLCSCGNFETTRLNELMVDSQVKANVTNSMVSVWPQHPGEISEPTEVFDMCLTYANSCDHYMNRIGCPVHLRTIASCEKQ